MSDLPPLPASDDPYEMLGLDRDDPELDRRAVKRAYVRLIKIYKPELAPDEFQRIRDAYERVERWVGGARRRRPRRESPPSSESKSKSKSGLAGGPGGGVGGPPADDSPGSPPSVGGDGRGGGETTTPGADTPGSPRSVDGDGRGGGETTTPGADTPGSPGSVFESEPEPEAVTPSLRREPREPTQPNTEAWREAIEAARGSGDRAAMVRAFADALRHGRPVAGLISRGTDNREILRLARDLGNFLSWPKLRTQPDVGAAVRLWRARLHHLLLEDRFTDAADECLAHEVERDAERDDELAHAAMGVAVALVIDHPELARRLHDRYARHDLRRERTLEDVYEMLQGRSSAFTTLPGSPRGHFRQALVRLLRLGRVLDPEPASDLVVPIQRTLAGPLDYQARLSVQRGRRMVPGELRHLARHAPEALLTALDGLDVAVPPAWDELADPTRQQVAHDLRTINGKLSTSPFAQGPVIFAVAASIGCLVGLKVVGVTVASVLVVLAVAIGIFALKFFTIEWYDQRVHNVIIQPMACDFLVRSRLTPGHMLACMKEKSAGLGELASFSIEIRDDTLLTAVSTIARLRRVD